MKHLNRANWLEPDLHEGAEPLDAEAWRDTYLAIRLDPRVPEEIAAMFEAARACMIYGSFYTPLVTLGVEHCYCMLEAAARVRCNQLGLPVVIRDRQGKERPLSFQHNLRQLIGREAIPETDVKLWMQAGELRDWAALPEHHDSVGPDHAVTALTRAAGMLGRLFTSTPAAETKA
ncbi:MAG: hypothetical protein ACK4TK_03425 [Thiobacillaceae bacterium]